MKHFGSYLNADSFDSVMVVVFVIIGDASRPLRAPSGNSSSPVSKPCSGSAPSWLRQYAPKFPEQAQTHKHSIIQDLHPKTLKIAGKETSCFPCKLSSYVISHTSNGQVRHPGSERVQSKFLILLGSVPISLLSCLPVNLFPLTSRKAETCRFHHTDIGRVSSE